MNYKILTFYGKLVVEEDLCCQNKELANNKTITHEKLKVYSPRTEVVGGGGGGKLNLPPKRFPHLYAISIAKCYSLLGNFLQFFPVTSPWGSYFPSSLFPFYTPTVPTL